MLVVVVVMLVVVVVFNCFTTRHIFFCVVSYAHDVLSLIVCVSIELSMYQAESISLELESNKLYDEVMNIFDQ